MLFRNFWLRFVIIAASIHFLGANEPVNNVESDVKEVRMLQEYYDTINNHNFTLVKYYTHWCSHCKRLKPIFDKMANEFTTLEISDLLPTKFFNKTFNHLPDFFKSNEVNVDYVSIECEIFGSFEICKRWPGYPVVELIPPKTDTDIHISICADAGEKETDEEEEEVPLWLKVFTKIDSIFDSWFNSSTDLDDLSFTERSFEFHGSRNEGNLKEFVKTGVVSDYERLLIDYLINGKASESSGCEITSFYKEWISSIGNKFIKVNDIISLLKNEEVEERRDLLFQKRLLTTLISLEEEERLKKKEEMDEL